MVKEIVLASASERRTRILSECGVAHRIVTSAVVEAPGGDKQVFETVCENAALKAAGVAGDLPDALVIGADTLVAHGDDIMGKPDGAEDAREMLRRFSGGEIEVYTGLCVIRTDSGQKATGYEKSALRVVKLSASEEEKYFRLLAPYDKAGGFSIEGIGALLFDNIDGSYFNILGLPMIRLGKLFAEVNLDILDFVVK
jgi:septum formation protein